MTLKAILIVLFPVLAGGALQIMKDCPAAFEFTSDAWCLSAAYFGVAVCIEA